MFRRPVLIVMLVVVALVTAGLIMNRAIAQEVAGLTTAPSIASNLNGPDQQPDLSGIEPAGGLVGDTITITGKNFGNDINTIKIHGLGGQEWSPLYLTAPDPNQNNQQELKVTIPSSLPVTWFTKDYALSVIVQDRQSNPLNFRLVTNIWRDYAVGIAIVIVALLLLLALKAVITNKILKDKRIPELLFLDQATNTYSLSKCQIFAWFIILLWSYVYYAVSVMFFVGARNILPDFNPSLIWLLGISVGGCLTSRAVSISRPKNDLAGNPPKASDLFCEGGEIDMTRLQLVGFTIAAICIYIGYVLSNVNLFAQGLPNIPDNLLTLMGVSHTGYILGKVVGGSLSVNMIVPNKIPKGQQTALMLIGTGFVSNTQVLFDSKLENATLRSPTVLEVTTPSYDQADAKQLILIPPSGSNIVINNAFEVVDCTLSDLQVNGTTVTGFDPNTTTYNVTLPAGTARVPAVTAIVRDSGRAASVITQATSLSGSATVVVTVLDGTTRGVYTIKFTVAT